MSKRSKVEDETTDFNDDGKIHKPIPFDDALRVLVNTPPKPKKRDDKKMAPDD